MDRKIKAKMRTRNCFFSPPKDCLRMITTVSWVSMSVPIVQFLLIYLIYHGQVNLSTYLPWNIQWLPIV